MLNVTGLAFADAGDSLLCIPERNDRQFRPHLIADSGNT